MRVQVVEEALAPRVVVVVVQLLRRQVHYVAHGNPERLLDLLLGVLELPKRLVHGDGSDVLPLRDESQKLVLKLGLPSAVGHVRSEIILSEFNSAAHNYRDQVRDRLIDMHWV